MFNSETLEVAVGMAFLFLSIALICTAVREWLEGILKWRAMDLERGLRTLLGDADGSLTSQLLRHPVLDSLFAGHYDPRQLRSSWLTPGKDSLHMRFSKRRNLPSYIPATQFAVAFLDMVARGPLPCAPGTPAGGDVETAMATIHPGPLSVEALRQSALGLGSPQLQRVLLTALDHSAGDLAQARMNIERWFNGTMDRTSGWYKRRTQAVLFLLGLVTAAGMNIDAFHVMQRLTTDKAFRAVVVNQATVAPGAGEAASAAQLVRIATARQALEQVAMPIGWRRWSPPSHAPHALPVPMQLCEGSNAPSCQRNEWLGADWLPVAAGWLATAFAVMLGAPFWFDVLNRFMVIRSTVKPHEKSPEEASQDSRPQAPDKPDDGDHP